MPIPSLRKPRPKTIGIVGSRRRDSPTDFVLLYNVFYRLWRPGDSIVSGGCGTGADRWAEELAREVGLREGEGLIIHRPDFVRDRIPLCYFNRNTLVARDVHVLIAVVADDRTGGTEDTIRKVLGLGKPIELVLSSLSPVIYGS